MRCGAISSSGSSGVLIFFGVGGIALWSLISSIRNGRDNDVITLHPTVRAALVSADGRQVSADVEVSGCGHPSMSADEDDGEVRLDVIAPVDPREVCPAIVRGETVQVTLDDPLGDRDLAADDGTPVPYFDGRRLLPDPPATSH